MARPWTLTPWAAASGVTTDAPAIAGSRCRGDGEGRLLGTWQTADYPRRARVERRAPRSAAPSPWRRVLGRSGEDGQHPPSPRRDPSTGQHLPGDFREGDEDARRAVCGDGRLGTYAAR